MIKPLQKIGIGLIFAFSFSTSYAVDDGFWLEVQNNKTAAVTRYLAQGVDPNIKSREQQPVVMWAIQNEAWDVYELLRQHRQFEPNITNANDETPLMYLAIMGQTERAQALIQQGAQVNRLGWTPLHYAASKKQIAMAQLLLQHGALVNAPAPDGTTPLMMAARSGSAKLVNLLLEQGADPTTLSVTKLSAADWAQSNKNTRLAARLREIAAEYEQKRAQNHGQVAPILLGQGQEEVDNLETAESRPSTGTSQYFDLKRFEE
ncbi:MAG: ankyrin repeat domain-containing protein [Alcaligenaceae bacterium]|nr:ankyrin repeat domain-containing protein [Alcaligenaceae bacterium]